MFGFISREYIRVFLAGASSMSSCARPIQHPLWVPTKLAKQSVEHARTVKTWDTNQRLVHGLSYAIIEEQREHTTTWGLEELATIE